MKIIFGYTFININHYCLIIGLPIVWTLEISSFDREYEKLVKKKIITDHILFYLILCSFSNNSMLISWKSQQIAIDFFKKNLLNKKCKNSLNMAHD